MKKIILSLAIIFAVFYSFAQTKQMVLNPGETAVVSTTPCPNVGNVPIVNPSQPQNTWPGPDANEAHPVQPVQRIKRSKRVYVTPASNNSSISNSFNTTNNYYYGNQPYSGSKSWCTVCGGVYDGHKHDLGWDWSPVWFFLGLVALICLIAWLVDRHRINHTVAPIAPVATPAAPIIIRTPAPAVVVTPSSDEIEKGIAHAKSTGGSFMRYTNGGYTVEFPKPSAEEKKDQ